MDYNLWCVRVRMSSKTRVDETGRKEKRSKVTAQSVSSWMQDSHGITESSLSLAQGDLST